MSTKQSDANYLKYVNQRLRLQKNVLIQSKLKKLKILLGLAITLTVLGAVFIIVSTVTLFSDNSLECSNFNSGVCDGYWITQDFNFCCLITSDICYAKFYYNGDQFTVNGLRYMGIAAIIIGIIISVVYCRKRKTIMDWGQKGGYYQLFIQK